MEITYTVDDTELIAQKILAELDIQSGATVLGLSGELGAGKTTVTQMIAKNLSVKEKVVSPTFVIAKFYQTNDERWDTLVHIDAYRIDDVNELGPLGWETIIVTPRILVIVEWPERIKDMLPYTTKLFSISHEGENRHIKQV
jgi:tRNA threonylcarbamoyladenosine biosynthesis protein TsaE